MYAFNYLTSSDGLTRREHCRGRVRDKIQARHLLASSSATTNDEMWKHAVQLYLEHGVASAVGHPMLRVGVMLVFVPLSTQFFHNAKRTIVGRRIWCYAHAMGYRPWKA